MRRTTHERMGNGAGRGGARPIAIDLFAGAGGMSLGFEQAGFDIAAAVEFDPVHAAVHHRNFPRGRTIPRSVIGLSSGEIRDLAGIGSRPVDVVFGGAPCQGFSLIGRRALDDPRNALAAEFVRLVVELDARCFVFENVKGLTVGRHRAVLDEMIEALGEAGYRTRLPWKLLNAVHFGVPQNRERLFLLGAKRHIPLPEYPSATTSPAGSNDLLTPTGPSCADALGDLPDAEAFDELQNSDEVRTDAWGSPSPYARALRCSDAAAWHLGYRRRWDPKLLTSSQRTGHTDISRRRFRETEPGEVEPISRLFKLAPHGVSNTLRAGTDSARGAFTSPRPIHYGRPRLVTVREMARLHGFPDWFRFHRTKWHGARQIGNAVAPPVARAIGERIAAALGATPERPSEVVEPGPDALLRLTMTEAAAHWDVPVPIGRRDRKSGDRKRKQTEIEALRLWPRGSGSRSSPICEGVRVADGDSLPATAVS